MDWKEKHKILSDLGVVTWTLTRKPMTYMTYNPETKASDKPVVYDEVKFRATVPVLIKTVGDDLDDTTALPVEGVGYTAAQAISSLYTQLRKLRRKTRRTDAYLVRDGVTETGVGYVYEPAKMRFLPYLESELCPPRGTRARRPRRKATPQDVYARIAQITSDDSEERPPPAVRLPFHRAKVGGVEDMTHPTLAERYEPPKGYQWVDYRRPVAGDFYLTNNGDVRTRKSDPMPLKMKKQHGGRRHIVTK